LQWSLNNTGQTGGLADADIDALEAWGLSLSRGGITHTNEQLVIAVVDAGFGLNHQDQSFFKNNDEIPNNLVRAGSSTTAYLGTYEFEGNNGQGASSCIIADKGATVTLATGATITIKEGGFLASEGGTFALGDNASISYTSTKPLAISPGAVFRPGSGAKITFSRAAQFTTTHPIAVADFWSQLASGC
jgi:hypothetical protein